MIRSARIVFCDNEHGQGDMSFPDFHDVEAMRQIFTEQNLSTVKQLRREASNHGWRRFNGVDYCPSCMESEES